MIHAWLRLPPDWLVLVNLKLGDQVISLLCVSITPKLGTAQINYRVPTSTKLLLQGCDLPVPEHHVIMCVCEYNITLLVYKIIHFTSTNHHTLILLCVCILFQN